MSVSGKDRVLPKARKMRAQHDSTEGRNCGFTGKGAVPQYPNRKRRTGPATVTVAPPADKVTREDHIPFKIQKFSFASPNTSNKSQVNSTLR